jgi:uncharacterized membrane protein
MSSSNRSIAKQKASSGKQSVEVMTAFQGPLPSPDILKGFEDVLPGSAERIMKMAEKEQASRHSLERRYASGGILMMILGMVSGLVSLLVIGYLVKYAIDKDVPNVAMILGSTSLVGVIGVFVWFRRVKHTYEK